MDVGKPIASILSRLTGRPVKLCNTREEEFTTARTRYPYVVYLKTGVKKDGKITAKQAKVYVDAGAYNDRGPATLNWAGLAYADISTGEFVTAQLGASEVEQELARLQPRECLIPDGDSPQPSISGTHLTPLPAYRFELGAAQQALLDHFEVATLDGFGCAGKPLVATPGGGA